MFLPGSASPPLASRMLAIISKAASGMISIIRIPNPIRAFQEAESGSWSKSSLIRIAKGNLSITIRSSGWLMARAALRATAKLAGDDDAWYLRGKVITARFFADQHLLRAEMLAALFIEGQASVQATSDRHL